ncbi:MAG: peptide-methionine (S)-S-oxide reductase [Bacteroidia bacterium]
MKKVGFSGTCYWCMEAMFQSLRGVTDVEQGWISTAAKSDHFFEGIIVHFEPSIISLDTLVEVHLHTHKSTSNHSMRDKYPSAVYAFSDEYMDSIRLIMSELQKEFADPIITTVEPFGAFKRSDEDMQNYYYSRPEKPFCVNIIEPKLRALLERFGGDVVLDLKRSSNNDS